MEEQIAQLNQYLEQQDEQYVALLRNQYLDSRQQFQVLLDLLAAEAE